ncbi:MAG: hypothetical protein KF753_05185 [Caldilineaceae bacterium]|nr:hypothetical protein [Caldilineaceae bacterium]
MGIELSFGVLLALLLALLWGTAVAWFIRFHEAGITLATHLMWFVVSVGCSGIFLISLLLIQPGGYILWWQMLALMATGAVPIAGFSLKWGLIPYLIGLVKSIRGEDG